MPIKTRISSHLHFLTDLANTRGHWPKEVWTRGRETHDRTVESIKSPLSPSCVCSAITKGPRMGSKLVQGKTRPGGNSKGQSISEKDFTFPRNHCNHAKFCVRTEMKAFQEPVDSEDNTMTTQSCHK